MENPEQSPEQAAPKTLSRILGLDVGDRPIGVAVSDELGLTAQPVLILQSFLDSRR
jgi:RNase H-fold protein (predicted Holliday junction resolvase)